MRFACASQPLECPVAVAAVRIDLGDRELIPMPSFEQLLQRRIRGVRVAERVAGNRCYEYRRSSSWITLMNSNAR
jgi:hypothetical protein